MFVIPHWIVQHILQHTQRPQFSGTHMAQVGAVVAAVGAPVFLLPTGVAGSSVDEFVQPGRVLHAIVHGAIVLEAAVIFSGRLAAGDTLRAQTLNILHSVKGACIENMGRLAAAVAGNAIRGLLKSAGFQRIGVIPPIGGLFRQAGAGPAGPAAPSLFAFPPAFWAWGEHNDCPSFPHIPSACPAA